MSVAVAMGSLMPARAVEARQVRVRRAIALVLDSIFLAFISLVVNSVFGVDRITSVTSFSTGPASGYYNQTTATTVEWPWLVLVGLAYFGIPEVLFGASPGKLLYRLRVVRVDGGPLDLKSLLLRNLIRPIDFLPLFYLIGVTSVLVTRYSQRLGDIVAGTTVVDRQAASEPGATRAGGRQARRMALAIVTLAIVATLAFDYFGRPPLVLEGLINTRSLGDDPNMRLDLGSPQWSWGRLTYAVNGVDGMPCHGSVTLDWGWFAGWQMGESGWSCTLS